MNMKFPDCTSIRRAIAVILTYFLGIVMVGCRQVEPPFKKMPPMPPSHPQIVEREGALWFSDGVRLFRSIGVNAVIAVEVDYTRGGARYPLAYDGPAAHGDDRGAWARVTRERLSAWGFNTLGAWSEADVGENDSLWHTPSLWLGGYRGDPDRRLIDVWDPGYVAEAERFAAEQIAPWKGRLNVLGFFLNNELPWYGEAGWPIRGGRNLLDRYLELPPTSPGRQRVADWLRTAYSNDYGQFVRDWETNAGSFEDVRYLPTVRLQKRRPAAAALVESWAGVVAERYFQLTDEIFRRHAPAGSLNLGVRFAGRVYPSVLAACGRYADVISFNDYQPAGEFNPAYFDALYALTRKPVLITEFSWRASENSSGCPNTHGAPVTVPTQRDRAARYSAYISEAAKHPAIIGWHWFCWADQPPGGRYDGENSNYGMVDIRDNPYEELISAMQHTHRALPQRNAFSSHPNLPLLNIYKPIEIPAPRGEKPAVIPAKRLKNRLWFDTSSKSLLELSATDHSIELKGTLDPAGWGGGLSLYPPSEFAKPVTPDGFSILGRRGIEFNLRASTPLQLRIQIVEMGAGPVGEQAYAGTAGSDGEVYISYPLMLAAGQSVIQIAWDDLDVHEGYGNQRGNRRLDLQALQSIDLYLPATQNLTGPADLSIESITLF